METMLKSIMVCFVWFVAIEIYDILANRHKTKKLERLDKEIKGKYGI